LNLVEKWAGEPTGEERRLRRFSIKSPFGGEADCCPRFPDFVGKSRGICKKRLVETGRTYLAEGGDEPGFCFPWNGGAGKKDESFHI